MLLLLTWQSERIITNINNIYTRSCVNRFERFKAGILEGVMLSTKSVLSFSVKDSLINVLLDRRGIQLIPLMTSDSNNGSGA